MFVDCFKFTANSEVVFVGGCTTGLHVTDELTKEQIRYTDDVDLIVDVMSYAAWASLQESLKKKGFKIAMDESVICRMMLGELKVDFMPPEESTLGFTMFVFKNTVLCFAFDIATSSRVNSDLVRYFIECFKAGFDRQSPIHPTGLKLLLQQAFEKTQNEYKRGVSSFLCFYWDKSNLLINPSINL